MRNIQILKSKEIVSLKPKGVPFLYEFQTSLMGENKSFVLFQIRKLDIQLSQIANLHSEFLKFKLARQEDPNMIIQTSKGYKT